MLIFLSPWLVVHPGAPGDNITYQGKLFTGGLLLFQIKFRVTKDSEGKEKKAPLFGPENVLVPEIRLSFGTFPHIFPKHVKKNNFLDSGDCTTVATQPRQLHYSNNLSK